jgi:hypothetical protein
VLRARRRLEADRRPGYCNAWKSNVTDLRRTTSDFLPGRARSSPVVLTAPSALASHTVVLLGVVIPAQHPVPKAEGSQKSGRRWLCTLSASQAAPLPAAFLDLKGQACFFRRDRRLIDVGPAKGVRIFILAPKAGKDKGTYRPQALGQIARNQFPAAEHSTSTSWRQTAHLGSLRNVSGDSQVGPNPTFEPPRAK